MGSGIWNCTRIQGELRPQPNQENIEPPASLKAQSPQRKAQVTPCLLLKLFQTFSEGALKSHVPNVSETRLNIPGFVAIFD
jgi:hypothetical protein